MKLHYLLPIILAILLAACSSTERELLNHADSIIRENPDSALTILRTIDRECLKGDDLPYYALLFTQAQIETGMPVSSDSLIRIAYEKYGHDTHGDKGIRSNFYFGETYFNKAKEDMDVKSYIHGYQVVESEGSKTVKSYLKAYEEAKRLGNHYWQARSANRLKHLFVTIINNFQGGIFAHEEASNFKKANMEKEYRVALVSLNEIPGTIPSHESLRILDSLRLICEREEPVDSALIYSIDFCIRQNQSYREVLERAGNSAADNRFSDHVNEVNMAQWDYYNQISEQNAGNYRLFRTLLWVAVLVFLTIIAILFCMFYFRYKAQKATMATNLESFLSLKAASDRMAEENTDTISHLRQALDEKERQEISHNGIVRKLLAEKWSTLGMLCDELFELRPSDLERKRVVRNIEKELKKIISQQGVAETVEAVDTHMGGLVSKLRQQCPFLKEDDINFLGLIFAGFSVRAVCMFTGLEYQHFYVKKSRLLKRIQNSDAPDKDLFIERIQKK